MFDDQLRWLSTKIRAVRRRSGHIARFSSKPASASAIAAGSSGANNVPVAPSSISSRWPPTSDAATSLPCAIASSGERKSVAEGKDVSVRVELGVCRIVKKKTEIKKID